VGAGATEVAAVEEDDRGNDDALEAGSSSLPVTAEPMTPSTNNTTTTMNQGRL
jgi:hypothetical protein